MKIKKSCWVIIMGSLREFASFLARPILTRNQQDFAIDLVWELFVLPAPLCMFSSSK
jgi:hypothetical protein